MQHVVRKQHLCCIGLSRARNGSNAQVGFGNAANLNGVLELHTPNNLNTTGKCDRKLNLNVSRIRASPNEMTISRHH